MDVETGGVVLAWARRSLRFLGVLPWAIAAAGGSMVSLVFS